MKTLIPTHTKPGTEIEDSPKGLSSENHWRIVITPPGRLALPHPRDLFEAREVFLRFAQRDITLRYRQTALGIAWVVLQPLLGAGVLSFVFGRVAKLPTGGVPPLVFTFAGLMAWNAFSNVVNRGSTSLIRNSSLVSKVYFPRMVLPISTTGSTTCDFLVSLAFLGILLGVYGIVPGLAILLLPIWLMLIFCLATGVALVTSSLMVSYRDIAYIVPFLLQLLLFASPVAYSVGALPQNYHVFFQINPMTWLLADMRWSLLHLPQPGASTLLLSATVPLAVLFVGSMVFERRERGFADFI
jgi:lipopolysaccharide transport system permease protein